MKLTRRALLGTAGTAVLGASTIGRAAAAMSTTSSNAQLLKPQRLQPGMTVGLVTPASNVAEDEGVRASMDLIRSLGFEVKPAPHLFERNAYVAGTDAQRAADLNAMFADRDVDAIFCVRGGNGSNRLLPMLDYDTMARNPKILMGYSDITAPLNAIHRRTGMVTFHGPIAAQNFTPYTLAEFRKVLQTTDAPVPIGAAPPFEGGPGIVERDNRLTPIVGGRAEGHLVGGNLSLLVTLIGTPFEPDFDGAILFLEDVDEPPYSIDRMLTHLWLAGALQRCAGIALGKFTDDDYDGNTFSTEAVLRDRFEPLGIPTLRGLMIGHIDDQTVLPIGARARLDVDAGTLTLLESGVV